nr:GNAT family N-acetyltransferase [Citreimonas salinaria]
MDAAPGQSKFEVGRSIIRSNSEHPAWFGNWRVAELNGVLAGAVNSYVLPAPSRTAPPAPEVKGLNDLKTVATGTWYIASAALHPEHQGKGFGEFLLAEAETLARTAKTSQLTLMVGSFNERARRLYLRFGFAERAKRPFTAFPGSDAPGEWILMGKDLA